MGGEEKGGWSKEREGLSTVCSTLNRIAQLMGQQRAEDDNRARDSKMVFEADDMPL